MQKAYEQFIRVYKSWIIRRYNYLIFCLYQITAAFVCDIASKDAFASSPVEHETSDFASLMFVLSAIGMDKNGINSTFLVNILK